jgi:phosphonate transport system permease protein
VTSLAQLDSIDFAARPAQHRAGSGSWSLWHRRRWMIGLGLLVGWSFWDGCLREPATFNARGWPQVQRFATAAAHPELSGDFLAVAMRAAVTTAGYALVGTALAVLLGVLGGVLSSDLWWADGARTPTHNRLTGRHQRLGAGGRHRQLTTRPARLFRLLAVIPRGMHEAVWALILAYVLGRNPLVAILAIGIPFGAMTAKVVADAIDVTDPAPVEALRSAGAGRLASMVYGVAPKISRDIIAYGFYRLECALRSSVVLGVIGAGGLGFQLALSFQSLRYDEIWTLIYILVLLSLVVDWWGTALRRRPTARRLGASGVVAVALTIVAVVALGVRPGTLYAGRSRRLAGDLARQAWPPHLPSGGWHALVSGCIDTIQLSVIAITMATVVAVPAAFLAARPESTSRRRRSQGWVVRLILLVIRSIPPSVWALMTLFVVYPGPMAGGLALAAYTVGVLSRLNADVVENTDHGAPRALRASGASALSAFAYGTIPAVGARFAALATYRWEVAARETVIVGLVGAGGLGRILAQQNAAQDEAGMLTTIIALVVLAGLIDAVSRRVRNALQ